MGRSCVFVGLILGACSGTAAPNGGGGDDGGPHADAAPDARTDAALPTGAYCATGSNTAPQGSAAIAFDIDVGAGPTRAAFTGPALALASPVAISEYIYGINQYPENNFLLNYSQIRFGLLRFGGDAYTTWNWTNNDENNGNDNGFVNTNQFMPFAYGSDPADPEYKGDPHDTNPAGAVLDGADSVPTAQALGIATLVTVSVADYVAANGSDKKVADAPSSDFVTNKPAQAAGGGQVYQDGFVHLMTSTYTAAPVFFSLDNEPNYWKSTHPEVFGTADLAFDDLLARDATTAAAVKVAAPGAKTFGPVVAGLDGFTSLDDYGDLASSNPYATSGTDAIEYYLAGMSARSTTAGTRLLDVLDLHYYNDSLGKSQTPKGDADCEQGPRDYWDPTYSTPDTGYDDYISGWKPRVLIPRITDKIAANFAGTGLSFSEYNNGCEQSIGGGVAEADTLGIFGQYGVFAATAWPLQATTVGKSFLVAAFGAFRGYDGHGATVGALALGAATSDPVKTSVYAFAHPGAPGVEVVAINKTSAPIVTEIRLANACALARATAFQLTSAQAAMVPAGAATITGNALTYTLPANSVTTLELR